MFLQSRQVPCQWRGHGCHDWLQVILGFAPIKRPALWPLVSPKPAEYRSDHPPLQVSFFSSTESFVCSNEPPQQSESENCPLHSLVPGGCPFVVAFWGYISYFPIFWPLIVFWRCCWLWKNNLSVCLFPPFFYIVMYVLQLLQSKKRFSINKHQDGEFLGEFNMYIIKYISLNLIFCFPVSFNT